jgi:hypothetical protein
MNWNGIIELKFKSNHLKKQLQAFVEGFKGAQIIKLKAACCLVSRDK